jgi:ubiquitin-conjugating enzyme E2 F
MEENLPTTVKTNFPDSNCLSEFYIIVEPSEGLWKDGRFKFLISINEDYNMMPPKVKCLTKILHPNISSEFLKANDAHWSKYFSLLAAGDVCLSLLRLNSIDGMGWLPTRRLKDVCFGINSLFTDLCDFDDPLNIELSEEYSKNNEKVKQEIREYVQKYAR